MRWKLAPAITAIMLAAAPATAQRGPVSRPSPMPTRPMPMPAPVRPTATDTIEDARRQAARRADAAVDAEAAPAREAMRRERAAIQQAYERDFSGHWRRRGEIVAAAESAGAVEAAEKLGLREIRRDALPAAGLTLHTFAVPAGMTTETAFLALKAARPEDAVDFNVIYAFQAVRGGRHVQPLAHTGPGGGQGRLAAVIDTALPERAPALAGVTVRARRFGPGAGRPSDHALAVAAVLADTAGRDGLVLLAADVSEPGPLPGASATAIAQALDWAASFRAPVVNISLTGPPNAALAAVVRRIAARDVVIVAAAGNDGPRGTPPYPAALPDVLGVTAVDGRLRIWRRATQGPHVDFAAPGVKVAAAGGEWTGTSLAAPVVAGLLLRPGMTPDALSRLARDLGDPGRDPVFGFGYVSPSR